MQVCKFSSKNWGYTELFSRQSNRGISSLSFWVVDSVSFKKSLKVHSFMRLLIIFSPRPPIFTPVFYSQCQINWTIDHEWMFKCCRWARRWALQSHTPPVTTHDEKRRMWELLQLEGRVRTEQLTTSSHWVDPVWLKREPAEGKVDILTRLSSRRAAAQTQTSSTATDRKCWFKSQRLKSGTTLGKKTPTLALEAMIVLLEAYSIHLFDCTAGLLLPALLHDCTQNV